MLGISYGPRTPLEQQMDQGGASAPSASAPGVAPAARPRRSPAANSAQVPLGLRGRIRDDFKAMYPGREFTAADLVRGYNAGLAAGEF
jgi:hypothetical protein